MTEAPEAASLSRVFRTDLRLNVLSCGYSSKSLRSDDLIWEDMSLVMEAKHRSRILGEFRNALGGTPVHVPEIPDDSQFMDLE